MLSLFYRFTYTPSISKTIGPFIQNLLLSAILCIPVAVTGQADSTRDKLVETLTREIYTVYLDAGLAKKMCDYVNDKYSTGQYETSLNLDEFVYEINKDLRRISKDNHFVVIPPHFKFVTRNYLPKKMYKNDKQWKRQTKRAHKRLRRFLKKYSALSKRDMFTYGEIKILPGNIGYVEIKDFHRASINKKENRHRISFKSVLKFLRNTHSIIIDFRENTGGYVVMAAKFCSYFTYVPGSYFITTKSIIRYDSSGIQTEVPVINKIKTDIDINNSLTYTKKIYVLTSKRTFSAAELSTYKLKQLNPDVTVIGEKTTGGANGHYGGSITKYFSAIIPCIKIYDEKKSNYTWEAKGIQPDIETTADSALIIACNLSRSPSGATGKKKNQIKYFKKPQKADFDEREEMFVKRYDDYTGNFRKVIITIEDGKLYMTYDFYLKQVLIPDALDYFLTDDFEFIRFKRNRENKVEEIHIKHKDGYLERFRKL